MSTPRSWAMNRSEHSVNSRKKPLLLLAFGGSLAVHGVAYASLTRTSDHAPKAANDSASVVSFDVAALPLPAAPSPSRAAEAPSVRNQELSPVHAPHPRTPPVATTTAAPRAPSASAPLDLSGVTLTNDTGPGFAMPVGDGNALH